MDNNQPICLCGSRGFTIHIEGNYDFFLVNGAPVFFQGLLCKSCGLMVTNPPPKEHITYMNDSSSDLIEQEGEDFIATSIYRFNKIRPLLKSDWRVLEIGCSSGKLVELVGQAEVEESIGIDLYRPMVAYAHKYGRNVLCESLESCNFPDGYFHLVHAHHLLEHVSDLHNMLAEMRRILNNNGLLYFTVPNYSSPLVRSTHWLGWFPQEHYWHFNKNTLKALLEDKGFSLRKLSFPMHTDFADSKGIVGAVKRLTKDILREFQLGDTIEAWFQKEQ
jgi:SAM-dependent methyltransferase